MKKALVLFLTLFLTAGFSEKKEEAPKSEQSKRLEKALKHLIFLRDCFESGKSTEECKKLGQENLKGKSN